MPKFRERSIFLMILLVTLWPTIIIKCVECKPSRNFNRMSEKDLDKLILSEEREAELANFDADDMKELKAEALKLSQKPGNGKPDLDDPATIRRMARAILEKPAPFVFVQLLEKNNHKTKSLSSLLRSLCRNSVGVDAKFYTIEDDQLMIMVENGQRAASNTKKIIPVLLNHPEVAFLTIDDQKIYPPGKEAKVSKEKDEV